MATQWVSATFSDFTVIIICIISIQQFWSLRQYIIISHYLYDVDYALLIFKVNEDSRVQFDSMGAKYVLSSKLVGTELRIYSNHVNSRKLFILF